MNDRRSCLACAAALLLSGCINEADYPSLDVRPIEKIAVADEPSGTPAAANDSALSPELNAAIASADTADAIFRDDLALAVKSVDLARGAAPDSEPWVAAQQALSRTQASRTPVASALALLNAAETDSQLPPSPALAAAIDRLTALDARQSAAMDALSGKLSAQ